MTARSSEAHPCGCGCGEAVWTRGARFRRGHSGRVVANPLRECEAAGCSRPRRSHAAWSRNPFCSFHYTRWHDTGDVVLQARRSRWDRFVDKVRVLASDCWEWTASGTGRDHAYGQFHDGKPGLAHRFSYETMVGPIPAGMELDHLCRVKRCVNPAHLEPVTSAENMRRMQAAKKETAKC